MKFFSLSSLCLLCVFLSLSLFSLSLSQSIKSEYEYERNDPFIITSDQVHSQLRTVEMPKSESERKPKLFPYFMIQFPNEHCATKDGSGICVSQKECRSAGGTTIGTCVQGFGACCRFMRSCGKDGGDIVVRENATEIRGGNGSAACRFVLPKGRNICQVRLDFTEFLFGSGQLTGECSNTRLTVNGRAGESPMNLCGDLKGQHLYLNYGTAERLYLSSTEPGSETEKFVIRVSYLRCRSKESVPPHCTQVFTESQGQIRSFNWPHQQLNNQEYTICIDPTSPSGTNDDVSRKSRRGKRVRNDGRFLSTFANNNRQGRRIEWSTCGSGKEDFFISGNRSDAPITNPADCDDGDYVQVFGGNRQCGNQFKNESLMSSPYLLRVRFDGSEMMGRLNEQVMHVSKPTGEGCETLNTNETICTEVVIKEVQEGQSKKKCKCMRASTNSKRNTRADFGNTGFCLAYKVVDNL